MRALVLTAALLAPLPALAHTGHDGAFGFLAGLFHPFSGADHLIAILMVGLWAGLSRGLARVALPGLLLAAMLIGFLLSSFPLPGVEAGILASTILLVAFAAIAAPLPLPVAAALVAAAGLCHGHAHGTEGTLAPSYAFGMLAGSALLLGAGLGLAAPLAPLARSLAARLTRNAA
jgi:urease accessory protein